MATLTPEEKKRFLEALRSDPEFRRAVAAELGLLEILERLDRLGEEVARVWRRLERLEERVARLEERMAFLEERMLEVEKHLEEHAKAIRALQEQVAKLQEQVAKMQEQMIKLQEQVAKMQEQISVNTMRVESLERRMDLFEKKLDALGARWGLSAESTVREALYKILQEYLGVARVEKWRMFDSEGRLFGRPFLVEIDVVVKDGVHYLIEVKSSIDKYDVYVFARKCDFYVEKVKPKKTKMMIVTFFADEPAVDAARELGVELVIP